jgi:translation elongation factor EF-Tu-like GTPase
MASYIPDGYSQTSDYFAMVMVDAPEFPMNHLTLEDAFQSLGAGVQSVANKTRNVAAKELLAQVTSELSEVFQQFHANAGGDPIIRKVARKKLQRAYYDLYEKVGPLLMPGAEIGPDDPV